MIMDIRRKIALWICPELAMRPVDFMIQKMRHDLCGGRETNPFFAHLTPRIPPRAGHAPAARKGPSLRLLVTQSWGQLMRAARWLDDSWIGDLIGVLCLFGIIYISLFFGAILS